VSCFDCGRVHKVIAHATSTICPGCGTYIDLRDVEIHERGHQRVRTRGKVIIGPKAVLSTPGIHCGDLHVYGQVLGSIHASGEVKFFSDGKVLGELRCQHLYIDRWTKVQFLQPIYAHQVDVHGELNADICCDGLLSLPKNAVINGNVLAAKMKAPDGVNINGEMCILSLSNLDYIKSNPSFSKLAQMFDLEKISAELSGVAAASKPKIDQKPSQS
jgi:cytoskeletal protein CcmA (bactofilin family)